MSCYFAGLSNIEVEGTGNAAKTKAYFKFSKNGAFVFKANQVKLTSIENLLTLRENIARLKKDGRWLNDDWSVITGLATAQSTSLLISSSSKAEIGFEAKGDLSGSFDIADPSLKLSVILKRDMHTRIVASGPMQPLMAVHGYVPDRALLPTFAAVASGAEVNPLSVDDYIFRILTPSDIGVLEASGEDGGR